MVVQQGAVYSALDCKASCSLPYLTIPVRVYESTQPLLNVGRPGGLPCSLSAAAMSNAHPPAATYFPTFCPTDDALLLQGRCAAEGQDPAQGMLRPLYRGLLLHIGVRPEARLIFCRAQNALARVANGAATGVAGCGALDAHFTNTL